MCIQKGSMCASNSIWPSGALSAYFQRHDKHHFGVHKMDGELPSVQFMFFLLKLHYRLCEREHLVPWLTSYLKPHCVSSMMAYQLSMSICCLTRSEKSNRVTFNLAIYWDWFFLICFAFCNFISLRSGHSKPCAMHYSAKLNDLVLDLSTYNYSCRCCNSLNISYYDWIVGYFGNLHFWATLYDLSNKN